MASLPDNTTPPHSIDVDQQIGPDKFDLLRDLGHCSSGRAMIVKRKSSTCIFFIKVLHKRLIVDNDEIGRVESEKRALLLANRKKNRFLVDFHACFQTEANLYFVMEYAGREDLMLRLQNKAFGIEETRFYAAEICSGLSFLHGQGILYRNLKLDNVKLSQDGHIKLINYFFCKENMGPSSVTSTFCGSQEFMAPELLLGKPYGFPIDWWAYGVLLYQMTSRQSPFRGKDEDEIYDAILQQEPLYSTNMPETAVSLVKTLLVRDPDQRLGSGPTGALDVMRHPFFGTLDWDDVHNKRMKPPHVPTALELERCATDPSAGGLDTDSTNPLTSIADPELSGEIQDKFIGFSYISGEVHEQPLS